MQQKRFFDHEDYMVIRDPRYNIAYWNLHDTGAKLRLDEATGLPFLDNERAIFVHFSGMSLLEEYDMYGISRHQNRYIHICIFGDRPTKHFVTNCCYGTFCRWLFVGRLFLPPPASPRRRRRQLYLTTNISRRSTSTIFCRCRITFNETVANNYLKTCAYRYSKIRQYPLYHCTTLWKGTKE